MGLKAKFIKDVSPGESRWTVHNLGKLILSMTVDELIKDTEAEYDEVATVEFGKWLMKEIRRYDADV